LGAFSSLEYEDTSAGEGQHEGLGRRRRRRRRGGHEEECLIERGRHAADGPEWAISPERFECLFLHAGGHSAMAEKQTALLMSPNYSLSLTGTSVLTVEARDGDGDGPNGQVTYSIVSQHKKFEIDPITGLLTTSAVSKQSQGRKVSLISC